MLARTLYPFVLVAEMRTGRGAPCSGLGRSRATWIEFERRPPHLLRVNSDHPRFGDEDFNVFRVGIRMVTNNISN